MLSTPEREATMKVSEFLDYLQVHATTSELAGALGDVLILRRLVPIPVDIERTPTRHLAG
jgi:hypothetical protein